MLKSLIVACLCIAAVASLPASGKNKHEIRKTLGSGTHEANWVGALAKIEELKLNTPGLADLVKIEAEKDEISEYGLLVSAAVANSSAKAMEVYEEMAVKVRAHELTPEDAVNYNHLLQKVGDKPMKYLLPLVYINEPVGLTVYSFFSLSNFLLSDLRERFDDYINE